MDSNYYCHADHYSKQSSLFPVGEKEAGIWKERNPINREKFDLFSWKLADESNTNTHII